MRVTRSRPSLTGKSRMRRAACRRASVKCAMWTWRPLSTACFASQGRQQLGRRGAVHARVAPSGGRVRPRLWQEALPHLERHQLLGVREGLARLAMEELETARAGQAMIANMVDGDFWYALGGNGHIAQRAVDAVQPEPQASMPLGHGVLFRLSDTTGRLMFDEVHRGALNLSMLIDDDVYVCDKETELIVWMGKGSSDASGARPCSLRRRTSHCRASRTRRRSRCSSRRRTR